MKAKEEKVVSTNKKTLTSNTTKQTKPEKKQSLLKNPLKKQQAKKHQTQKLMKNQQKQPKKAWAFIELFLTKLTDAGKLNVMVQNVLLQVF